MDEKLGNQEKPEFDEGLSVKLTANKTGARIIASVLAIVAGIVALLWRVL